MEKLFANNVKQRGTGYVGHESACVEIKNPYKFSIAAENAQFEGYTTEKLLTSLAAHTIPIYFGDPEIEKIVNPKCFINCNKLNKLEDVLEIVNRIDSNDNLWLEMVASPWQTEEQVILSEKRKANYYCFFKVLFNQPLDKAVRRPIGCRPKMYWDQFKQGRIYAPSKLKRAYLRFFKSYLPVIINKKNNNMALKRLLTVYSPLRLWRKFWLSFSKLPMLPHVRSCFLKMGGVNIGRNSLIYGGVIFDTVCPEKIFIGNNVTITRGTTILTHYLDPSQPGRHFSLGEVHIEDEAFLGVNICICSPLTIGKGAIIGAVSVVTKDIPPYQVWAGNPAHYIKDRAK